MLKQQTILVLGATGRTGRRVVEQLLKRGVNVRAIVRSSEKLPAEILEDSRLTLIEAGLLFLTDDEIGRAHV